jgi:nucleoside-diphosphate-sugar epimerase
MMRRDPPDVTIVTGAGGWLGNALIARLAGAGCERRGGEIRALVTGRTEADRLRALAPGVVTVCGDVRAAEQLGPLFAGLGDRTVDVIHAAGVIHPRTVAEFEAINATGTRNVAALARTHRVRRMVHVSSNSPFGTNPDPGDRFRNEEPYAPYYGYGTSKMHAELAVFAEVERGLDAVVVRPPWFYGPYQPPRQTTFFSMVRAGRFPIFGRGDQQRSMVYVDNLVDGVLLAELTVTDPGRGWWIADARPYSVTEIVETVGRALADEGFDVAPNRLRVPDVVARMAERADAILQRSGRYNQQVHVLGELNKSIACDISVATTELGYEPAVALYDGMRTSIRWCREQGFEL